MMTGKKETNLYKSMAKGKKNSWECTGYLIFWKNFLTVPLLPKNKMLDTLVTVHLFSYILRFLLFTVYILLDAHTLPSLHFYVAKLIIKYVIFFFFPIVNKAMSIFTELKCLITYQIVCVILRKTKFSIELK